MVSSQLMVGTRATRWKFGAALGLREGADETAMVQAWRDKGPPLGPALQRRRQASCVEGD
jgi:hypothetical protein